MADRERNGYTLSTDPGRVDVETVHRWLSQDAYWALGRPREVVETTVCTCDVWSVFAPDGAHRGALVASRGKQQGRQHKSAGGPRVIYIHVAPVDPVAQPRPAL